jgi:hypothetical protein
MMAVDIPPVNGSRAAPDPALGVAGREAAGPRRALRILDRRKRREWRRLSGTLRPDVLDKPGSILIAKWSS